MTCSDRKCSEEWFVRAAKSSFMTGSGNRAVLCIYICSTLILLDMGTVCLPALWVILPISIPEQRFGVPHCIQMKYLEIVLCPVSLLIYIRELDEHSQLQKTDLQKNQFQFKQVAGRM